MGYHCLVICYGTVPNDSRAQILYIVKRNIVVNCYGTVPNDSRSQILYIVKRNILI